MTNPSTHDDPMDLEIVWQPGGRVGWHVLCEIDPVDVWFEEFPFALSYCKCRCRKSGGTVKIKGKSGRSRIITLKPIDEITSSLYGES